MYAENLSDPKELTDANTTVKPRKSDLIKKQSELLISRNNLNSRETRYEKAIIKMKEEKKSEYGEQFERLNSK
jgi:hypothetical protein